MKRNYWIAESLLEIECDEHLFPKDMLDYEIADTEAMKIREQICRNCNYGTIHIVIKNKREMEYPDKSLLKTEELEIYETKEEFIIRYNVPESVCCCVLSKNNGEVNIYLNKEVTENPSDITYVIRNAFFFYLQKQGKTVIHSSSVIYNGRVWLFSAPSGIGKSTHVELWKDNQYPIEDFNGDMAACYIDAQWNAIAAGVPWCGTSKIQNNLIMPLGGILFLKRGKENSVKKLGMLESVMQITARALTPCWNRECVDSNIAIAETLAERICVGELICTIEREAAGISKEFIDDN